MTLLQKPSKHKGHEPPNTGGRWAQRKSLYHLSFVYVVSFVLKTFLQWTRLCKKQVSLKLESHPALTLFRPADFAA